MFLQVWLCSLSKAFENATLFKILSKFFIFVSRKRKWVSSIKTKPLSDPSSSRSHANYPQSFKNKTFPARENKTSFPLRSPCLRRWLILFSRTKVADKSRSDKSLMKKMQMIHSARVRLVWCFISLRLLLVPPEKQWSSGARWAIEPRRSLIVTSRFFFPVCLFVCGLLIQFNAF